jgi:hypothetical protein
LVSLIDDGARRQKMGTAGRVRVERELSWNHQAARYLGVYDQLVPAPSEPAETAVAV